MRNKPSPIYPNLGDKRKFVAHIYKLAIMFKQKNHKNEKITYVIYPNFIKFLCKIL